MARRFSLPATFSPTVDDPAVRATTLYMRLHSNLRSAMLPPASASFLVLPLPYLHKGYAVLAWLSQTRTQGRVKLSATLAELRVEMRDCKVQYGRSDSG